MYKAVIAHDPRELVNLMKVHVMNVTSDSQLDLLIKIKDLLQKSVNITSDLIEKERKYESSNKPDVGNITISIENLQFYEPRGRYSLSIGSNGIEIKGKTLQDTVIWKNISNVITTPSSYSTKKEGEDLLAIQLKQPIMNGQKPIKNILLILSRSVNMTVDTLHPLKITGQ